MELEARDVEQEIGGREKSFLLSAELLTGFVVPAR
jgi:hypothetical protein